MIPETFEAYKKVNQQFAEQLTDIYQPGDVVWVHDYQLLLLPQLIRNRITERHSLVFFCTFLFRRMKFSGCYPALGRQNYCKECWVPT